jgi:hypothetical protein
MKARDSKSIRSGTLIALLEGVWQRIAVWLSMGKQHGRHREHHLGLGPDNSV